MKRRHLLKTLAITPAIVMVPGTLMAAHHDEKKMKKAAAAPANLLSETEGMGKILKYNGDATKSKARKDKAAMCMNCNKWNVCHADDKACKPGKADAAYNPCSFFNGKVVAKGGWCSGYGKNV